MGFFFVRTTVRRANGTFHRAMKQKKLVKRQVFTESLATQKNTLEREIMRDDLKESVTKRIFRKAANGLAVSTVAAISLSAAFAYEGDTKEAFNKDPYPSTYAPKPSPDYTLIRNATVLAGTGEQLDGASVLVEKGKIKAVGTDIEAPEGAVIVDASGKWVTPGIIDVHSHLGAWGNPAGALLYDGNEMVRPVTADVWIEHALWMQEPGFARALEGGVTTLQILPGSGNLIGGRGVTLKNVYSTTREGMKFPGAPYSLKMACGENPKRYYRTRGGPATRMGNQAGYRKAWIKAQAYKESWDKYETDLAAGKEDAKMPKRDLELDTLAGVLKGEILVHNHCYRADEMNSMINMSKEFGYKISTFHHAVESYKITDILKEEGICSAMWADWWGFKMEAYDMVQENVAIVDAVKNSCAIVHSDSEVTIQRLNQEAGKILYRAQEAGFDLKEEDAIRWVTANAAKSLGIEDSTGDLSPGKNADVVIRNGNPFSVYALAEQVFIDGAKVYDRHDKQYQPISDFNLGQE